MSQITELTVEECLELIRTRKVGRIALRTEAGLRIFPVNYSVVGDDVYFRTLPYGAIANNAHQAEVAFEVDELDEVEHIGWSVVAAGTARRVEDPEEVRLVREQGDPEPWADGARILYFAIAWTDIDGREIARSPAQAGAVIPQSRQAPTAAAARSAAAPQPAPHGGRR